MKQCLMIEHVASPPPRPGLDIITWVGFPGVSNSLVLMALCAHFFKNSDSLKNDRATYLIETENSAVEQPL